MQAASFAAHAHGVLTRKVGFMYANGNDDTIGVCFGPRLGYPRQKYKLHAAIALLSHVSRTQAVSDTPWQRCSNSAKEYAKQSLLDKTRELATVCAIPIAPP